MDTKEMIKKAKQVLKKSFITYDNERVFHLGYFTNQCMIIVTDKGYNSNAGYFLRDLVMESFGKSWNYTDTEFMGYRIIS